MSFKKILAELLFKTGVISTSRWIRIKWFKKVKVTILCYHRISDIKYLFSPQNISPKNFERQVSYFKKKFNIKTVTEIANELQDEQAYMKFKESMAFSFDDGYLDNYQNAFQILNKHNLKGTFYIVSEPTFKIKPLWYDELSKIILTCRINQIFEIKVSNVDLNSQLKQLLKSSQPEAQMKALFKAIKKLSTLERLDFFKEIKNFCIEHLAIENLDSWDYLDINQALEMQSMGHEIGGHTNSHPTLSQLDENEGFNEIHDSKFSLEKSGLKLSSFAYPFGEDSDVGNSAPLWVQKSGYKCAVTTAEQSIDPKNFNIYKLPRKVVSPQSLAQLVLKIEMLSWK